MVFFTLFEFIWNCTCWGGWGGCCYLRAPTSFPEASNSQFQVLEFSSVYKCSSQFRYQWLVSFYVFILRYILAASVSFQTHLWQCYSSIARQMVLVSTILWTEPGFEIHFFCVGRMECINLTYNNWLKRGKQHTFQRLCPPQNIRHLGHHPNSAAGTGALQLTLTLWPPERVHRACSTHDPFAQITFSSARHNSGVLFTLLTGWSFAQQRLPLVGRKTLAMQQLQEPKSEIFVNPTLKAAGKSFCSSKVCILSHQCQRLINLYFFSLGSVRDFYRAVFISLVREKTLSCQLSVIIPVQPLEVLNRAFSPRAAVNSSRSLAYWRSAGYSHGLFCTWYLFSLQEQGKGILMFKGLKQGVWV